MTHDNDLDTYVNRKVRSIAARFKGVAGAIEFPCMQPVMVPTEKVVGNSYNPNRVATPEFIALVKSILRYGFAVPIAAFYDSVTDTYIIIDGFHRYIILKYIFECPELPLVVINRDIKERMAATIIFNRARGEHATELMSNFVAKLVQLGWDDIHIAEHLAMEAEEVLRLKQLTGYAGLFKGQGYSRAWERYEDGNLDGEREDDDGDD